MKLIKEINKKESGQALIIVLILLVLGGLMIGPLLAYMNTGLLAGQAYEKRMDELYAADAGVEDALWQIITKATGLPQDGDDPPMPPYSIDPVNGKVVYPVIIEYIDEITYKITSTATSIDTGSSTKIESYMTILEFDFFLDNAITSLTDVEIQPGSVVNGGDDCGEGDVLYNGSQGDPPGELDNKGEINACTIDEGIDNWPEADGLYGLSRFYWDQVKNEDPYTGDTINVTDTPDIDPGYSSEELLTITNQKGVAGAVGTLDGTVYVTGDLEFEQPGGKTYEIFLNGQTIFALGEIRFPSAGAGEPKCTLSGSGCIIAVGDIDFHPNISSEEGNFIFVMSIEGTVNFQPNGDFYGSIAGDVNVNLQPGCSLTWSPPPDDLNLPGAAGQPNVISAIRTWEISLQ